MSFRQSDYQSIRPSVGSPVCLLSNLCSISSTDEPTTKRQRAIKSPSPCFYSARATKTARSRTIGLHNHDRSCVWQQGLQIGTSGPRSKGIKRSTSRSGGQGHRRAKLDLEAWRRHHSRPSWVEYSSSSIFWLNANYSKVNYCWEET